MPNNFYIKGKYQLDGKSMYAFSKELYDEFKNLDGREIYGRINPIRDENNEVRYQVSLTTKNMIKQDVDFIELSDLSSESLSHEQKGFLRGYHPFVFEFFVERCQNEKILKKKLGIWIKMKIFFSKKIKANRRWNKLEGVVVFGASPLRRKGASLVFTSDVEEVDYKMNFSARLPMAIKCSNCDVKDIYGELLNRRKNPQGIVWNVGQANSVSLNIDADKTFFDVGLPVLDPIPGGVKNCARRYMQESEPAAIVLSHWDMDHWIGVVEIGNKMPVGSGYSVYSNCCWIAPDLTLIKNRSYSSERLCFYLLKQGIIWLINRKDYEVPVLDTAFLSIWQGNGMESNGGKRNNIGLIIKLVFESQNHSCQSVLLTGDCACEAMPEQLTREEYCTVLSPHHGSRKTSPNFRSDSHNSRAIISVGKNRYHHPSIEHIMSLLNNKFRVYYTAGCRGVNLCFDSCKGVHIKRF